MNPWSKQSEESGGNGASSSPNMQAQMKAYNGLLQGASKTTAPSTNPQKGPQGVKTQGAPKTAIGLTSEQVKQMGNNAAASFGLPSRPQGQQPTGYSSSGFTTGREAPGKVNGGPVKLPS